MFSLELPARDARDAPEDGHAQRHGDLVGGAQAQVELLEQKGEADAGEQADAEAEDRGAPRVGRDTAPSGVEASTSTR